MIIFHWANECIMHILSQTPKKNLRRYKIDSHRSAASIPLPIVGETHPEETPYSVKCPGQEHCLPSFSILLILWEKSRVILDSQAPGLNTALWEKACREVGAPFSSVLNLRVLSEKFSWALGFVVNKIWSKNHISPEQWGLLMHAGKKSPAHSLPYFAIPLYCTLLPGFSFRSTAVPMSPNNVQLVLGWLSYPGMIQPPSGFQQHLLLH